MVVFVEAEGEVCGAGGEEFGGPRGGAWGWGGVEGAGEGVGCVGG